MVRSLADFDFDLPRERIAQSPSRPRDAARMLCVRPVRSSLSDPLDDRYVRDLPELIRPGDVLVTNDTRVIPARLTARRGTARVGITLNQPHAVGIWSALARNARCLRKGDSLEFDGAQDLTASVIATDQQGGVTLQFNQQDGAFVDALHRAGALALPPYIHRPCGPERADAWDYQTIFAAHEGAVAAPTAGLHFTPDLLAALESRGVRQASVTLHVGAGTFLPVRSDDVTQHHMHAERGEITAAAALIINSARAAGGRIIAVGTTSLRLLESAVTGSGAVSSFNGDTSLFIVPGYRFRTADLLMTNFHLPRSTLFMLVCAFAGTEKMRAAYAHAIASKYRFYSYGDASLLWRHDS
ncbi:MAG: tRNA preQ1(34) S-adenosylmethionine ribosyltransferase-isomerase QueA [Acetobacteraceae bacterium]|jgi:S-adenosylmethionine:tRNA ribosyltransferase-isomerase